MDGDERIRLFCALRLPTETTDALVAWQSTLALPAVARPVPRENLHVTLVFLGSTPRRHVDEVAAALRGAVDGLDPPRLSTARYRETRSVGMVVLEDEGGRATALAGELAHRLAGLGLLRPESRAWLPHVTVVRFRRRPRITPEAPDLGVFVPSEATVTMSVLRPTGAQYADIESVALGG